MSDHTSPSDATQAEEAKEAKLQANAGRLATPEEEAAADSNEPDPAVAEAEAEYNKLGANVKGEGELP